MATIQGPVLLDATTTINEAALKAIAYMPTEHLDALMGDGFAKRLTDAHLMRIAVMLAQKSANEGGGPIGEVIIDNETRRNVGKGHNTLVQESHPYNHGETSAMRDAGRVNFAQTTLFTSLSPCEICATLLYMRGVSRVVIGDVTHASGTEALLRKKGVHVDILENEQGVALYSGFRADNPALEREDWQGVRAR